LTIGSSLSSAITAAIAFGFFVFGLGVALEAWNLLDQFRADLVLRLVVVGFLVLVFAVFASKLFSRIE
jgi:hypothetical protein